MPTIPKARPPLPSEVFVAELGPTRRRRDLTQQDLADRLEALGSPIDRSTIGKIEAGRRNISLDELFSFALALGVSPLALVVPRSRNEMTIAPSVEVSTQQVVQWARNQFPLWPPEGDPSDSDYRFFDEARTDAEAGAFRAFPTLQSIDKILAVLVRLASSQDAADRDQLAKAASILGLFTERLMEDAGGKVELDRELLSRPVWRTKEGGWTFSEPGA